MRMARALVRKLGGLVATLTAVSILVLLGVGGWLGTTRLRADLLLREARRALDAGRFDEAREQLTRCLELRPAGAEVFYLAGRAARRAGAADEAREYLRRGRELGWPEESVALEEVLLVVQQDPRPYAGYLLERVRQEDPERELILEALSRGYLTLFDPPMALHCLDRWLELNPDAVRALSWRGDVRERMGQTSGARDDFQRVVELDPEQVDGRTRLAKLLLRERRLEEATAHFAEAHRRRPDDVEVLRGLARCRQEQNRRDEAEQLLDRALALRPDDVLTLTQSGCLALEVGRLPEAEAALRRAATLAPFEREPLFNLSRCLHAQGKHDAARAWEERLVRVEADLTLVRKATNRVLTSPTDPEPRREVGVIFLRNGQEAEGLRWLHSALACDPTHRETHDALADYYEKHGRPELAARHRRP